MMGFLFNTIAKMIEKRPMKVLLISILIFALLIVGVTQIEMATGNETLVKKDTEAYLSNLEMEENFGGDSIIVLFEGESKEDLVSLDTISKMWNVEQALKGEENIFSFITPATIVNQISDKQSVEIKKRLKDISSGLADMSFKMTDLGNQLNEKELKDPKEIEKTMNELSQATAAFDKLIDAQRNMGKGTEQLQGGMGQIADGLSQLSMQMNQMAENYGANNPQLKMQLQMIGEKLTETSNGLDQMATNTGQLNQGHEKTANALDQMKNSINGKTSEMTSGFGDALSPEQLMEMATGFLTMGEKLGEISSALDTFHQKSGMMKPDIPVEQAELDTILYEKEGELRSLFGDVIVDDTHALMIIKLAGNIENAEKDVIYQKIEKALSTQDFQEVEYIISGKPVLDSALRSSMTTSMQQMVLLAVGLMFLILLVIFKVRWRILSLPIIFFAVVATLGLMGFVNIPMTMVSMAVFPILIGLGVDYAIQFQSRYEEERSLKTTIRQMGTAVGTAIFATVLGFVALFLSPVPMILDFGKMLTIGVIISYIAGIFILMSILYIRDHYFKEDKIELKQTKEIKPGLIERLLKKTTGIVIKFSPIVLILAVIVAGFGIVADEKVGVQTDIETFMPQNTPELEQIHELRDVLGATDQIVLYIQDDNLLSEDHIDWIDQKTQSIKEKYPESVVDTKSVTTLVRKMNDGAFPEFDETKDIINEIPEGQRKMFINEENNKAVIMISIKHMDVGDLKTLIADIEKEVRTDSLNVTVTGKSVLDVEMIDGLTSGRVEMTFIGMGLVFLGLLLVYRNPIRAFIPVFPISLIVGLSGGIMYLLDLKYTPLTATLGALIIGIGTEFTILLLERYMEEREKGKDKMEAIQTAVSKIGKAIIASGMTVIGGFSALIISDFIILQDFGMMTVINMSLALFSTLIVLPPVIYLLDRWIVKREKVKKTVPVLER